MKTFHALLFAVLIGSASGATSPPNAPAAPAVSQIPALPPQSVGGQEPANTAPRGQGRTLPELFSREQKTVMGACQDAFILHNIARDTLATEEAFSIQTRALLRGRALFDSPAAVGDPDTTQRIIMQTPAATSFNSCVNGEINPEALPVDFYGQINTLLYIGGTVADLDSVQGWTALVAALDSRGKELTRFEPSKAYKGETDAAFGAAQWEEDCGADACRWFGMNVYVFDLGLLPAQTQTVRLLYTRGDQLLQRDYTAADFFRSQLR